MRAPIADNLMTLDRRSINLTKPAEYKNAQDAWLNCLMDLYKEGDFVLGVQDKYSVGSAFGHKTRNTQEIIAYSFSIRSPRQRIIHSLYRRVDISYAIANTIWVLTGSDDVETISFYNPRGKDFSDDGISLFSAPGARIFLSPDGNQFENVINKLKSDPNSRRAVIQINLPSDLIAKTRDCSCVISLQFLLRGNKLSCITHMRSQSALMVMPYDIFLFTMLHEAIAVSLGVELGSYYHFCGSLHYYEDEENLLTNVINANESSLQEMSYMTSISDQILKNLLFALHNIKNRLIESPETLIIFENYELDSYWSELLKVMVAGVRRRYNFLPSESDLFGYFKRL